MSMLNNYITKETSRAKSRKDVPAKEMNGLLAHVSNYIPYHRKYVWDANINGIIVRYVGNSEHQYDFWRENWWPAPNNRDVLPHAFMYSVVGVPDMEPQAFYSPELNTSLFVNTEYYGQAKSWALGMAAAILERHYNTHSIHGACAELGGRGVVIVAPTGTGKTTQVNRLFQHPNGKVVGDDWVYIEHPPGLRDGKDHTFIVRQPERRLYVRTENEENEPWLRPILDGCKCENVVMRKQDCQNQSCWDRCARGERKCVFDEGREWCFYAFANARALLPREWMKGEEKVGDFATLNLLVLLRRDSTSPAQVNLDPDEAVRVLLEGKYMIRPGAGPKEKWGTIAQEAWYNPYLLVRDDRRQEEFFRREVESSRCVLLNTGVEGIMQTHDRIVKELKVQDRD
ncbi:MAG: hypothetical protein M1422_05050 [Candidatus Thermoplasmatota archaeon]|jgi:hypothetical protein|nr:hypothetical protein [Candidatus Sysuiplasma jiujiangense]MBX8639412.1 hypothetical protein [Candidatus Sysuiplasma jiujiangense]MBX8641555.1 hypothetical protein [Candidatus Sysuiplasma jiujiangense]MCL4317620.1 hypothetical protein [Candidatus Thermoplasmatota archaeon]